MTSQTKLRMATGTWFAVLVGGLVCTNAIAGLDTAVIAVIAVIAGTIMFTCMQIIVREMVPETRLEVNSVREFRERKVSSLALRNLVAVSVIYALLSVTGALPF